MELYNLKKNKLEEVSLIPFKLEKDIQALVEKSTDTIFQLEFIESEFRVEKYRIDTLCLDVENNSFVIIEYKKGSSYSVVDQGMTYLQLMLNNKSDFILKLSHHFNKVLSKSDIDWTQSKIIFVAESFNAYQKDSVNFKDLPFELWEIKKFSNDSVVFNRHKSNSKESISSLSDPKTQTALSKISSEVKVYNEEDLISNSDEFILNKWDLLKELINDLADTELVYKKKYINLRLSHKAVAYFRFRKQSIRMHIVRGTKNKVGSKSKSYFDIDDPKKIALEYTKRWGQHPLGGTDEYRVSISKDTDIDYLMFLIKQKYKNLRQ